MPEDFDPWTDTVPDALRPFDGARCVTVQHLVPGDRFELAVYCGVKDSWDRSSRYTGPLFGPFNWADAYMVVPDRRA